MPHVWQGPPESRCGGGVPEEEIMTKVSAKQNKARAKTDERDVAKILGGERHPADVGGPEDVRHPWLSIQVKGGLRVVNDTIRIGLAAAQATTEAKLPAVVLVDRGGTRVQRFIVFELGQFADWYGLGQSAGEE